MSLKSAVFMTASLSWQKHGLPVENFFNLMEELVKIIYKRSLMTKTHNFFQLDRQHKLIVVSAFQLYIIQIYYEETPGEDVLETLENYSLFLLINESNISRTAHPALKSPTDVSFTEHFYRTFIFLMNSQ